MFVEKQGAYNNGMFGLNCTCHRLLPIMHFELGPS